MATNRNNSAKQNRHTKHFSSGKLHPSSQSGSHKPHGREGLHRTEAGRLSGQTRVIAEDSRRGSLSARSSEPEVIRRPSISVSDKVSDTEPVSIHFSEDSYNRVWREIVSNRKR